MSKSDVVTAIYQDFDVHFTEDGWFNATEAAERFEKAPNDWLRLPTTKGYLEAVSRKYGKIPYLKTKRGAGGGTWLHPRLAVHFARWLDDDFAVWCDAQIDGLLRGTHPHNDWRRMRHEAASGFKVMTGMVKLIREEAGKETAARHYINEARLVNWALTGEFTSVDRDSLDMAELDVLAHLEARNTIWIARGLDYAARKLMLEQAALDMRALTATPLPAIE